MQEKTKPRSCGVCNKISQLSFKESFKEYTLWECSECAGQFWTPMKNPGAEWYEKDERYSFRNLNPLKKIERNHREFFKDLPVRGGRLLDIGMGTGNFLAAAVAKGYDGYGIDFDRDAIKTAQDTFGLKNVHVLDIDGAISKFGEGRIDIVTMFEVLEHLDNPSEFIDRVKALLKRGGFLAISVPYRNTPNFLRLHDKPPRHLTRWDEASITNFMQAHGFSVTRIKVIPTPIPYLITKLHFWFKGLLSFNLVQKIAGTKNGSSPKLISKKIRFLQHLARLKDYILFFIPATFLYLYLAVTSRRGLGLYIIAKKL